MSNKTITKSSRPTTRGSGERGHSRGRQARHYSTLSGENLAEDFPYNIRRNHPSSCVTNRGQESLRSCDNSDLRSSQPDNFAGTTSVFSNFRINRPSSCLTNTDERNFRTKDNSDLRFSQPVNAAESTSSGEPVSKVQKFAASTEPIRIEKVSLERRLEIMRSFGFILSTSGPKTKTNNSQTPNATKPPKNSKQNIDDCSMLTCANEHQQSYSSLDDDYNCKKTKPNLATVESSSNNQNILPGKSACRDSRELEESENERNSVISNPNNVSSGKKKNSQDNNGNKRFRRSSYNPFLENEAPGEFKGYLERSDSSKLTGTNYFNVQRPARDINERVPTREEALERVQEQYNIDCMTHQAKMKEKEAKKREQYLAKYSHIDLGHRLNDGLLDEAAGFAPGYSLPTEEEVRKRQQEKLRRDALYFRERMREEEEKKQKQTEKKSKEKIEKNKHLDAGYTLGSGDNKARLISPTDTLLPEGLASPHQLPSLVDSEAATALTVPDDVTAGPSFCPPSTAVNTASENKMYAEFLLEGETEEEALQRQEEQLIIELLIEGQQENLNKAACCTSEISQLDVKTASPIWKNQNPPCYNAIELEGVRRSQESTSRDAAYEDQRKEVPAGAQTNQLNTKKLTSCMMKNQNGAVLVVRPTPEELNRALVNYVEIQDEMDKLGYSIHYKTQIEEEPLYSNNRFERLNFESVKPTGAIPKNISSSASKAAAAAGSNNIPSSSGTTIPEGSAKRHDDDDIKAEMRAARLKQQQQYEDALKKMQCCSLTSAGKQSLDSKREQNYQEEIQKAEEED